MVRIADTGPLGVQGQIAGHRGVEAVRLGAGLIGGPADEHLAVKGWIGRFRHGLPVFHGCRSDGRSSVRIEGHGVCVRSPLRVQRHILGHRCAENVSVAIGLARAPPRERVSFAGRLGRHRGRFAVTDELRVDRAAAGRVERDFVGFGPLRVQRHRSVDRSVERVRLGAGRVGGPADELVAVFRRRGRLARHTAHFHGLRAHRRAAPRIEGHAGRGHGMRVHGRVAA